MYIGQRIKIPASYWNKKIAGNEVTILRCDFANGLYIEVVTDDPDDPSFLVGTDAIEVPKNPLDL